MTYDFEINDYIGYPVSKEWVAAQLKGKQGKPISVRVSSYGGDVMTALDIRQQFVDHGNVTVYIFGMTASAATILAMGAKKVVMSNAALMLVHKAAKAVLAWDLLNEDGLDAFIKNLQKTKADLNKIDGVIANIYALKTGGKIEDAQALMAAAKWMNADDCKKAGLIDSVIEEGEAEAVTDRVRFAFAAMALPVPEVEAAAENGAAESAEASAEASDDLAGRVADLEDELGRLRDIVDQLMKVPGESTDEIKPAPADNKNAVKDCRDFYNKFKGLF